MSYQYKPVHPGIFIKEEIEARDWTQRDLAFILRCPEQSLTQIIKGNRGVTPEMAKALALAFNMSPEFFLNLQQKYDLAKTENADHSIKTRLEFQKHYPAREMIKRGWIKDTKDPTFLEQQLIDFFEVNTFEEIPYLPHAAKKTTYKSVLPSQLAWLFKVKKIANSLKVGAYNKGNADKVLIPKLRTLLINPDSIKDIPGLLADFGIRIVFVEPLKGAKIDGACLWLDNYSPVIGLSLRYDRIDNFWFCLFHELGHILNGDGKRKPIIDIELENSNDEKGSSIEMLESRANKFAVENCFPEKEINNFIKKMNGIYPKKEIKLFSDSINVHPGLIVGRLQHLEEIPYSHHRAFLVKIRHLFMNSGVVDGWGKQT